VKIIFKQKKQKEDYINQSVIYHIRSKEKALEFKEFLAKSKEYSHMLDFFENENELATALFAYDCGMLEECYEAYIKLCERSDFRKGNISHFFMEDFDEATAWKSQNCEFKFRD